MAEYAEQLQQTGLLAEFEQALSLAVLEILGKREGIEDSRFRIIDAAIRESLAPYLDTTVILRLLEAGVESIRCSSACRARSASFS